MGQKASRRRKRASCKYSAAKSNARSSHHPLRSLPQGHADPRQPLGGVLVPLRSSKVFITWSEDRSVVQHSFDSQDNALKRRWEGHQGSIACAAASPDGQTIYTGCRDLKIRRFSQTSSKPSFEIEKAHELTITAVAARHDGALLASGSRDTSVRIWDAETMKRVARTSLPRNLVTCGAFVPGQTVFAHGAEDLAVRTWDTREKFLEPCQTFEGYVYFPLCIDFSNDGQRMLTGCKGFGGSGCKVKLWDMRAPSVPVREFAGHEQDVVGCTFLPDQSTFATASKDGTLRVWDAASGVCSHVDKRCQQDTSMYTGLQLSEDPADGTARLVATAFSGAFYVFRWNPGAKATSLEAMSEMMSVE